MSQLNSSKSLRVV